MARTWRSVGRRCASRLPLLAASLTGDEDDWDEEVEEVGLGLYTDVVGTELEGASSSQ